MKHSQSPMDAYGGPMMRLN